ncbi:LLM class flavin-dependent oxidoreductase [Rhodococcus opacus]|uniref:LLM class flavin-dependent oxidoreductase n=1 Tax=Rhodococcus opacus TaxID=37919 RepID=UPI0024766F97|nr:LLM class flavin-dependent oxidoreductase [Rhodococcus opacus]MDH6289462.1 alkanesulfonate monooxygenase SsuD/methylene tetrahydromethanopterin reductase-like flavin-dependent oxidoreductase (luciferase family) [Rhodococcus opacus]
MSVIQRSRTFHGLALGERLLVDAIRRGRVDELAAFITRTGADFVLLGVERVSRTAPRPTAALSPSVSAAALIAATDDVGVFVTAVPHLDHPYNLARRLASLDHTSRGRVGWLTGVEDRSAPGNLASAGVWIDTGPSPAATTDAIHASRTLWESWPADTIRGRPHDVRFADSDRIVYADHRGVFDIAGPLNVPTPPQQKIPVAWWAQDGDDIVSAAEVSDIVVLDGSQVDRHGQAVRERALLFVVDDPGATEVDGHIATVTDLDAGFAAWPRPARPRGYRQRSLRATLRLPEPAPAPAHRRPVYPGAQN